MLADLVPALILVVCTDGYNCDLNRNTHRQVLAQPSFDLCIETLKAMPRQPQVLQDEQPFATTATCAMVDPKQITR